MQGLLHIAAERTDEVTRGDGAGLAADTVHEGSRGGLTFDAEGTGPAGRAGAGAVDAAAAVHANARAAAASARVTDTRTCDRINRSSYIYSKKKCIIIVDSRSLTGIKIRRIIAKRSL